ncbi:hypothetical protein [Streptomyces sp.]|uniref:hypothetical protein n=1 Tax=Streptomyces sp. TaxID=1931 RepID=UPI002D76D63F|nr:hypothetical protein [Streptomyces sp.]HET6357970.1 hypothetical protein [Streptomyces sp.]
MTRHVMVVTLRTPTRLQRLWYRRLGIPAPAAVANCEPRSTDWVRLLPSAGAAPTGGTQRSTATSGRPASCAAARTEAKAGDFIPDPTDGPGMGILICSQCTRDGRGWRVPHPLEAVVDEIYARYMYCHDDLTPGCPTCEAINAEIIAAFDNYQEPT